MIRFPATPHRARAAPPTTRWGVAWLLVFLDAYRLITPARDVVATEAA